MTLRIAVDRIRCDGRGLCAELFPEVISLDDWGYPVVAAGSVPDHLLPMAELAVSSCPVMALRLAADARAKAPALTGVSQARVTLR
jgi:ferredoxin